MKMNKRDLEWYKGWTNGLLVFVAIFMISSLALAILYDQEKTKNNDCFNTTIVERKVCWNETKVVGEQDIGESYNVTKGYKVTYYDIDGWYDLIGSCRDKEYIEEHYPGCTSDYCKYKEGTVTSFIHKRPCIEHIQPTEEIKIETERCEFKDVNLEDGEK